MKVLCSIVLLVVAQTMGLSVPKTASIVPAGTDRIINGEEAVPNEYPWVVWLSVSTGISGYSCTGSLISDQWVLTAGHCQQNVRSTDVYLGAHNVRDSTEDNLIVTATGAGSSFVHPEYNGNTLKADIALIKLPSPVTLTSKIQPITLDTNKPDNTDQYVGATVVIAGWGKTSDASNSISSTLQKGTATVITNAECANTYGSIIGDGKICTTGGSSVTGAMGTCNGDSGSALFTSGANPIQIGVTSFVSSSGCESGNPDGFANVGFYRNWIDEIMANN